MTLLSAFQKGSRYPGKGQERAGTHPLGSCGSEIWFLITSLCTRGKSLLFARLYNWRWGAVLCLNSPWAIQFYLTLSLFLFFPPHFHGLLRLSLTSFTFPLLEFILFVRNHWTQPLFQNAEVVKSGSSCPYRCRIACLHLRVWCLFSEETTVSRPDPKKPTFGTHPIGQANHWKNYRITNRTVSYHFHGNVHPIFQLENQESLKHLFSAFALL